MLKWDTSGTVNGVSAIQLRTIISSLMDSWPYQCPTDCINFFFFARMRKKQEKNYQTVTEQIKKLRSEN